MSYQDNTNNSGVLASTSSNGAPSIVATSTENPKRPQQKQTAQQLVRENVQYLIEQLEAGHSEALTGFPFALWPYSETIRLRTKWLSRDSGQQLREWRACTHGTS
jgi:hypothetical protein